MRAIWRRLKGLGDDVSDLPNMEELPERHPPWPLIRLALELSILAAAAALFYLTLR